MAETMSLLAEYDGSYYALFDKLISLTERKGIQVHFFNENDCPSLLGLYRPGLIHVRNDIRVAQQIFILGHELGHRMCRKGREMERFAAYAKEVSNLVIKPEDFAAYAKEVSNLVIKPEDFRENPKQQEVTDSGEIMASRFSYLLVKMLIKSQERRSYYNV